MAEDERVGCPPDLPRRPIYLDHNATTPVDTRVVQALLPALGRDFGNPSSAHAFGAGASHETVGPPRWSVTSASR